MEHPLSPILAFGLIFGTLLAQAAPKGSPQDYALQTKYFCQAHGVAVYNKDKIVSNGDEINEVQFVATPGKNQALTFGNERESMIWPRVANGTFSKSLNVLSRERGGNYRIMQEVDMGEGQKTKTYVSLSVKDGPGESRPVSCRIEMEWMKKAK